MPMTYFIPLRPLCLAGFCLLAACGQPPSLKEPELFTHFRPLVAADTLRVEISEEGDSAAVQDTIPNRLFFSAIPSPFLQEIDYLADSSQALVSGRYHFPLDDSVEAYWVEIRQFWFQHQSLLLYDKGRKQFTGRVTLAEWYGGEGGQVLTGSWIFDFDGDGKKDILRREIQHSMTPAGDTATERTAETASLFLWKNGRFTNTPLQDTAAMVKRFPIRTFW